MQSIHVNLMEASRVENKAMHPELVPPLPECSTLDSDTGGSIRRGRGTSDGRRRRCKLDANSNPPITLSLFPGVIRTEVSQQRERASNFSATSLQNREGERGSIPRIFANRVSLSLPCHLFADRSLPRSIRHNEAESERAGAGGRAGEGATPRGN